MKKLKKKGSLADWIIFSIVAFVLVIVSGLVMFLSNITYDHLHNMTFPGVENSTLIVEQTMGKLNSAYNLLPTIAVMIIIANIIAIIVFSALVRTNAAWFFGYVFIVAISALISVSISNTYETFINNANLITTYSQFSGANVIILNLPIVVIVGGFIGAIVLFINIQWAGRDGNYE